MHHYSLIEDTRLWSIVSLHILVILVAVIRILHIVFLPSPANPHTDRETSPEDKARMRRVGVVTAFVMTGAVLIGVGFHMSAVIQSASFSERILSELRNIEWANPTVQIQDKKASFFSAIQTLMARMAQNEQIDAFLNVLLFLSLLRVIANTSVHPRLALLTGTIVRAADVRPPQPVPHAAICGAGYGGDAAMDGGDALRCAPLALGLMT